MKTKRDVAPRVCRFAISMIQSDYDMLEKLAAATQKPVAVCGREIILRYLAEHSEKIEATQDAANEFADAKKRFEEAQKIFNSNQMSLFPELTDDKTEAP